VSDLEKTPSKKYKSSIDSGDQRRQLLVEEESRRARSTTKKKLFGEERSRPSKSKSKTARSTTKKKLFGEERSRPSRSKSKTSATGGSEEDPRNPTARRALSGVSSRTRSRTPCLSSLLSCPSRKELPSDRNQQDDQNVAYVEKGGVPKANNPAFFEICEKKNPWKKNIWLIGMKKQDS
jgi:hypothetical protein